MRFSIILSALVVCSVIISVEDGFSADGRKIAISQSESAKTVYDKGFAQGVMREGNEAVKLWNHTLFEDDAPGSGTSNKGSFLEPVFGDRVIKKVLRVDEPRCMEAHVVFYTHSRGKPPLTITVNGNTKKYSYQGPESYAYVPIEPSWLKKGNNEIIFACPEAKDKGSGYVFYISRADEYIPGGGDPAALGIQQGMGIDSGINLIIKGRDEFEEPVTAREGIGKNSMISTNGGRSWSNKGKGMLHQSITKDYGSETKFDEDGVVGEYTARLNLTQYVYEGNLISPVIDLWSEPDNKAALIPFTEVEKLTLSFQGVTPPETQIVWQIRTGLSMDPYSEKDWSQWFTVATGNSSTVEPKGRVNMQPSHWDPERSVTLPKIRYIQWRAILTTNDPLRTPHVTSVSVDREITRRMEVPKNIMVRDYYNPDIKYSSTGFAYQSADEPMNKVVIERDDLDKIVKNASGEFDSIVRLLDYASRRWVYSGPLIEYPKWNTIDMSERAHSLGDGGMCIQFAAYLAHILTVMGYHARHVNIQYHEVTEVWCNEFEKWIYLDPTQAVDLYMYDKKTGIPLSLYDMHQDYYELYGIDKPIDWMVDPADRRKLEIDTKDLPNDFSTTDPRVELSHKDWVGYYTLLEFLRMNPRNDFSTTTIPEPLQQGCIQWPWDGYINWYDELAPPKLQYSRYTDRICDFWPTLSQVHFEAVPEINGDMVFVTMTTFTPSFKTFQVRVDDGQWEDSDDRYVWRLHSGENRLEMRALSEFGVGGHPSFIECNFVVKHIPKPVNFGSMNQ